MIYALVTAAHASDGSLELRLGARGAAEATVEQEGAYPESEPAAMVGILGDVHHEWASGPWMGLSGFTYAYGPESEPSLLEITPSAGLLAEVGRSGHVDLGARATLDVAPFHAEASSARLEAFGDAGATVNDHRLEGVFTAVDRRYLSNELFNFSMAELGAQWTWRPGATHLRLRGTFEANTSNDAQSEAVLGTQVRASVEIGRMVGRWDLNARARFIGGFGGIDEDLHRPQFSPSGVYLDDADALSEGGQLLGRLDLSAIGAIGERWTVDAVLALRLRQDEADEGVIAYARTLHSQVDVARRVGDHGVALTAGAGVTAIDDPALFDPSVWIGVRWSPTPVQRAAAP